MLLGGCQEKLKACTHIFEVLEDNLCLTCKANVIKAVDSMPYKRQKLGDGSSLSMNSTKGSLLKVLMGFIALVSVVCLAMTPSSYTSQY